MLKIIRLKTSETWLFSKRRMSNMAFSTGRTKLNVMSVFPQGFFDEIERILSGVEDRRVAQRNEEQLRKDMKEIVDGEKLENFLNLLDDNNIRIVGEKFKEDSELDAENFKHFLVDYVELRFHEASEQTSKQGKNLEKLMEKANQINEHDKSQVADELEDIYSKLEKIRGTVDICLRAAKKSSRHVKLQRKMQKLDEEIEELMKDTLEAKKHKKTLKAKKWQTKKH